MLISYRLLIEPFGFARASRHKDRSEGARGLGQNHLVGHALIRAQRSFRGEQVRSDVRVLVRRAGGFLSLSLIEICPRSAATGPFLSEIRQRDNCTGSLSPIFPVNV